MKRLVLIAAVLIGVAAVFGVVNVVNAQDPTPPPPEPGYGGMMGRWGHGRGMMGSDGPGVMHDYMQAAVASKLGLTVDELDALYDEGKTFWQIAEDQGLELEDARQLLLDARNEALDEMVSDGVITQEQADWMKNRFRRMTRFCRCMSGFDGDPAATPRGRMWGGRW